MRACRRQSLGPGAGRGHHSRAFSAIDGQMLWLMSESSANTGDDTALVWANATAEDYEYVVAISGSNDACAYADSLP